MRYQIVEATPAHVAECAYFMREADIDECWASSHSAPLEALMRAYEISDKVYAGLTPKGEVVCIFGIAPRSVTSDVGCPWMLATDQLDLHARKFARASLKGMRWFQSAYPKLQNYVDARNESAVNWIKWLGFTVEKAGPWGPDGVDFHRFHWERENV